MKQLFMSYLSPCLFIYFCSEGTIREVSNLYFSVLFIRVLQSHLKFSSVIKGLVLKLCPRTKNYCIYCRVLDFIFMKIGDERMIKGRGPNLVYSRSLHTYIREVPRTRTSMPYLILFTFKWEVMEVENLELLK